MARGCLAQRYRIATPAEVADLLQSAAPSPLSPAPAVPAAAAALEASDEEDEDEDEEGEDAFFELDFDDAEEGAFSPAASPSRLAGPPQGGAPGAFVGFPAGAGLLGSSASSAAASSSRRADAGAAPGRGLRLVPLPPRAPLSCGATSGDLSCGATLLLGGGGAAEESEAISSLVLRGLSGYDVAKQILCGKLPHVLALPQVLAPPPSLEALLLQYGLTTKLELYVNDAGFERCWYAVTVKKIVSASPLLLSLEYT